MKSWSSKISLVFFFIVALIGTSLRGTFLFSVPLKYGYLVHAHSHVAFQGWIYTILFLLLVRLYLSKEKVETRRYALQFKLTIPVIVGVLIAFALQGYGLYSIVLSTLFQLLNYWFIYRFFHDAKESEEGETSIRFVKTGLWLGLLSTLIPFGIGALSAKGLNGSEAYNSLIYTFLHLQYNGWFLFVALGLFYKIMENDRIAYHSAYARKFYLLFTWTIVPAVSLSMLGMSYAQYITVPAYLSGFFQVLGIVYFYMSIKDKLSAWLRQKNHWMQYLVLLFLACFGLKVFLQLLSAFPIFREFAFQNKPIMLAYLHLSLLGVITMLLLGLLVELKWILIGTFSKIGISFFTTGFIITESMLVLTGIDIFSSHWLLFFGSLAMALGLLCLLISPKIKNA